MSTQISKNFTLEELSVSASHPELVVPIPVSKVGRAIKLVTTILQPARDLWGKPIKILSCYRSDALNKAVQGSPTSQHRLAEAGDCQTDDAREFFIFLMKSDLPLGQVIYYPTKHFVHAALPSTRYPKPSFFVCRSPKVYDQIESVREI